MLTHRAGAQVVQCNVCHRVATDLNEVRDEWLVSKDQGRPEVQAHEGKLAPGQPGRPVVEPPMPAHFCPSCVADGSAASFERPPLATARVQS
jgi:hypothetical protein